MTNQSAHATLRELTPAEMGLIAGGQTAVELSLSGTFNANNGIVLNNSWGYTDDGEFFQDTDCNGYYDTVFFDLGGGDWVTSTDGGWHWNRTGKPNYYDGGCVYVVDVSG